MPPEKLKDHDSSHLGRAGSSSRTEGGAGSPPRAEAAGAAAESRPASPATIAELIGHALARLGAGHCFGVVGSGNFAVTNALRAAGIPFTASRHEGGAATMADAYARMSGRVGLVSVHQGCGLTNAATGIGESAKSRTPVIVLAAETSGASVGSNFAMDQPGFARSLTAESHRVHSAASALVDVVRAFRTARDERRTVVLNLPLDVQAQPVPDQVRRALEILEVPSRPAPPRASDAAVRALADALERAERPVVVAGRGAREAGPQLRALAEACGALLATSAVANGLFRGDPFDIGISGGFASPLAAELIAGADLILGVGCALNMWTMRHGRLVSESATVVQIDLETQALGAQRSIDLGVVGDSAETAAAVTAELDRRVARRHSRHAAAEGTPDGADSAGAPRLGGPGYRSPELAARIAAESRWADVPLGSHPEQPADFGVPGGDAEERIDPRVLSRELDRLLPAERIVSIDSGNFMGYPSAYLSVPDENGFCFTQAFQSIGLGLGTAIGAALARPDRLPVLGVGDGGFLMAIADLETAVRLALPLVVVVYDDDAYGAEIHHFAGGQKTADVDLGTVVFPRVDIASIARGFGAEALTVRRLDDLALLREWLAGPRERPVVVDARIASDGGSWWLAEAFRGH